MRGLKSTEFWDERHDTFVVIIIIIAVITPCLEFEHERFKQLFGSGGEGVIRRGGDAVAQSPLLLELLLLLLADLLLTMIKVEQRHKIGCAEKGDRN